MLYATDIACSLEQPILALAVDTSLKLDLDLFIAVPRKLHFRYIHAGACIAVWAPRQESVFAPHEGATQPFPHEGSSAD